MSGPDATSKGMNNYKYAHRAFTFYRVTYYVSLSVHSKFRRGTLIWNIVKYEVSLFKGSKAYPVLSGIFVFHKSPMKYLKFGGSVVTCVKYTLILLTRL